MNHQGLLAGLLGCFFGILGIFTVGPIFVPLAAICSLVGLLRGAAGPSISGIGCSLLAAVLTIWGFAVSPSLWLLTGILLATNHQSTTVSPPDQRELSRLIDNSHDAMGALSSNQSISIAGAPQEEASFLVAVTAARSEYYLGQNDMAKGASRLHRKKALCGILTGMHIDHWVGKASSLTTNGSGKGIVVVKIESGITIATTNNAISDAVEHTLLPQDSTVFQQAMTVKEGDTISFSGNFIPDDIDCIREMSMTLEGSMTAPEFLFHFTSIEAPRDASSPPPPPPAPTTAVPALDRPPAKQPNGVTSSSPYLTPAPEIPAATASATPAVTPLPTGPVTMYDKGLADRAAWENWFNGLQGDFKTGAFFWAGQRSLPHPGSCSQMNADFYNGCTAAKERLATADALRFSEPDYKRGWNAYASPGATIGGTPAEAPSGANSGGTRQEHKAGGGGPRRQPASVTAPRLLPSAQTAGSNFPNPKCFTVYPAMPPADCFAH